MTRDERFPDMDQLVRVRCKVVYHQHTVDALCFGRRLGDQLGRYSWEVNLWPRPRAHVLVADVGNDFSI